MCSGGHPWCMWECRSAYMLGSEPVPGGFLSHLLVNFIEECQRQALHLHKFFCRLCMTDLLSSSFYALSWVSQGIPSSYWPNDDIIPLPPKALPPAGESSNQQHSYPNIPMRMHDTSGPELLQPSFLIQLLKSQQLKFTKHLHTEHIIHHGSRVPGKCV